MAISRQRPEKRKIGVHVSLDLEVLGKLDDAAVRMGLSRSELLRLMVEEWSEGEAERLWVERRASKALAEERIPWAQAKSEMGL